MVKIKMAFDNIQFPTNISRGASSKPRRVTDIVTLRSGFEERNTIWANSRRTFDLGLGLRNLDDIYATQEFWEGRRGPLRSFRFKDWTDYKSTTPEGTISSNDQSMKFISGRDYQLQKTYSSDNNPWIREITKPVDGTVEIRDSSGARVEGTDYTVNYLTGVVYFINRSGPPRAGFEFDVPVRFQDDEIDINIEVFNVGSAPTINLVEVRDE